MCDQKWPESRHVFVFVCVCVCVCGTKAKSYLRLCLFVCARQKRYRICVCACVWPEELQYRICFFCFSETWRKALSHSCWCVWEIGRNAVSYVCGFSLKRRAGTKKEEQFSKKTSVGRTKQEKRKHTMDAITNKQQSRGPGANHMQWKSRTVWH